MDMEGDVLGLKAVDEVGDLLVLKGKDEEGDLLVHKLVDKEGDFLVLKPVDEEGAVGVDVQQLLLSAGGVGVWSGGVQFEGVDWDHLAGNPLGRGIQLLIRKMMRRTMMMMRSRRSQLPTQGRGKGETRIQNMIGGGQKRMKESALK